MIFELDFKLVKEERYLVNLYYFNKEDPEQMMYHLKSLIKAIKTKKNNWALHHSERGLNLLTRLKGFSP